MCVAGILGDDLSCCVPFSGRHAQDLRHLGRYGPEGQYVDCRFLQQFLAGIAGGDGFRAVFPSVCV